MPSSRDVDAARCRCPPSAPTRTAPPSGEYLMALESRLEKTCARRRRSTLAISGPSATSTSIGVVVGAPGEQRGLLAHELADVDGLGGQRQAALLDQPQVDQVVDERGQPARLLVDRAGVAPLHRVVELARLEQLREAQDAGQRRPQLVADGGHEVVLGALGGALGGHVAQQPHRADDLAVGLGDAGARSAGRSSRWPRRGTRRPGATPGPRGARGSRAGTARDPPCGPRRAPTSRRPW